MGIRQTLVNRERSQFSKRIFGLLVIGLIFTVGAIGCVTTDAGVTQLPVAVNKPTTTASTIVPPNLVVSPTPAPSPTGIRPETAIPDIGEGPVPGSSPMPVSTTLTLNLTILAPTQREALDVGAIRVLGVTWANAQVTVNGISTEVSLDGSFTRDLILGEGINSVEAIAKDDSGQEVSESLVLLFVPRLEGVPLSILFPQGLEVSDPNLTIMGATRPDAVVGVNGIPVDINNVGIFSTAAVLEEGTNLIEVVAVDLDENVNFQTVVVFYIP